MGDNDVKKPIQVGKQFFYPKFIPITPDICDANSEFVEYKVGSQDILTIIVWNHPELTIPSMQTTSENVNIYPNLNQGSNNPSGILVNEKGEMFFPLAGVINVNGKSVNQIREQITNRLKKYIRHPQVSVRVNAFRNKPVYILGEVVKSGVYYISDMPITILDIINQSGGVDKDSSDTHYIYVIRGEFLNPHVYWLNASTPGAVLMAVHFKLQPRDIVIVSTAPVARYSRVMNKLLPTIQTFMHPPVQSTIIKDND